ncbi:DUF2892 domain-containing protein [Aquamicrobium sp.]|uniref:YgaP family membrane protein n=1 Tax=Aquamicrobium sp. TaxID=1872579 RepID=UPI0025853985|nr:DUF2892 domain-containing protein [Aquamicrobium sp.]MCK9550465.1 DUF2892 domain-containing protein [Aquamicrobium sp.]
MKPNVGTPDRIARLVIGVLLIVAPFVTGWAMFANPVWTWAFVIVGLVLVVTGLIRFCPAYAIFNLSTSRTNDK